jgi:hypothetical protein
MITSRLAKLLFGDILKIMGNKFFTIFGKIVLVLIILGGVGYGAYIFGTSANKNQAAQTQDTNQATTTSSSVTTKAIETQSPTQDETDKIISDVRKGLIAEHGQDAGNLKITVSKVESGKYASGGASEPVGGGGMWFAIKINETWTLVWDGNGTIQCSKVSLYPDFPVDMIPECYNDQTQAMVKR